MLSLRWRRAHPRSRGENAYMGYTTLEESGSSPLTRGKPSAGELRPLPSGLIPAHAGKTRCHARTPAHRWAHPRSRGENPMPCPHACASLGSSPLTRGKPMPLVALLYGCVAHPRSRGENGVAALCPSEHGGSSPLTRGKRRGRPVSIGARGLIPAHAGKTEMAPLRLIRCTAHPRSRGENQRMKSVAASLTGSSPLTRGKRRPEGEGRRRGGLIPAHAGKTPAASRSSPT